jgi:hypothetical protein
MEGYPKGVGSALLASRIPQIAALRVGRERIGNAPAFVLLSQVLKKYLVAFAA